MADTIPAYFLELERVLGRQWSNEDVVRTMNRLRQVVAGAVSVEEEINHEVAHLGLAAAEAEQLAHILYKYYRMLLRAWSAITEVRSTPTPAPPSALFNDYVSDYSEDEDEDEGDDVSLEETISTQLKTRRCNRDDQDDQEAEICCICLEDLYRGIVAMLDCRHEFHADCIRRWIVRQNFCPLCKARAIG